MDETATLLVTGAAGQLGALVCRALSSAGRGNIVAASRSPEKLTDLRVKGIEVRRADFDDSASLEVAFEGIDRALIISTDALSVPGQRKRQHRTALEAAIRSGVKHVAYTSMPNAEFSSAIPFAQDHQDMEAALRESGLGYSVLRNSWYQENLLAYLPNILRSGIWFTAAGDGRIAFVSRADAADAAAKVLAFGHGSEVVEVAGPEALTVEEIAVIIREVLGLSIRVEHVSQDRLAVELARQGVLPEVIPMVLGTEANQRAGHFDVNRGALCNVLGRPAKTLADFFRTEMTMLLAPVRS